jgi:nucleotide-binding universal stress UspA family protein
MPSFKHILVPTDFGEVSMHAADVACELAERFGARLTLFHVWSIPIPVYAEGIAVPIDLVRQAADEALEQELARVRKKIPAARGLVISGAPASGIVEADGCDLVVIGTHGRRGLSRAILGSVAEKVVRTSPVPVLSVHPA